MSSKFISRGQARRSGERGQTNIFVLLLMGIFFLGFLGFAVDYSNLWFHRQMTQTAADAACQAGVMDLLVNAVNGTTLGGFPSPIADFDCSTRPTSAPCQYAALNGYTSATLVTDTQGTNVKISFPASVPGAVAPPSSIAPTPYIKVAVIDRTGTYFSGLITGKHTVDVGAVATCGLMEESSAAPIVVLNPHMPNALYAQGHPAIIITGGPQRSIQVNSDNSAAVNLSGSPAIDLTHGGPAFTGGDLGVLGGPSAPPAGFLTGPSGRWVSPAAPAPDPFQLISAPTSTGLPVRTGPTSTPSRPTDGCPDPLAPCDEYSPGFYPSGIQIKNKTAIFNPGLYFVVGGMNLDSNSTVRPSSSTADPGGTTFYFSGTSTITVNANSGKNTSLDAFATSRVQCPGGPAPTGVPSTLGGNILMGPCTGTYGTTGGQYRGILFFQDRAAKNVNPSWGGGGQFLLVGNMYFHSCSPDGSGACPTTAYASGYYTDIFTLQGNSGSGTWVLGLIITDSLQMGGTSSINMNLNPSPLYSMLKAGLLQ